MKRVKPDPLDRWCIRCGCALDYRCTCSEECPHHEGKPSFQLKGLP